MSIPGARFDHSIARAAGAAATVDIEVDGIKAAHRLMAVIGDNAGVVLSHDLTDFTVAANKITAGTIDTTGEKLIVIYTDAPGS